MHVLRRFVASSARVGLVSLVAGGLVSSVACGRGKPASYPDHDKVEAAQKTWCEMLADLDGDKLDGWRYRTECLAAYPAGSSVFVAKLAECYGNVKKGLGDEAPDSAAILDKCSLDVLATADPGDVTGTPLYQARCARKERCSEVSRQICDQVWEQLDGTSQASLTSIYNLKAQADIAACLNDTACSDDEESAVDACYEPARDATVWLPLSLGPDPSLGPKVD